jgi:hypothetical protein
MMTTQLTPARRRRILISVAVVTVLGFGQLVRLLIGNMHGWWAWTSPFALWGMAYMAYSRYLKETIEHDNVD